MRLLTILTLIFLIIYTFTARNTPQNKDHNVNMNPDGFNPSRYYGEWTGHKYFPSPSDWRKESIYQFITDRFADGNPLNNESKYGGYNLFKVE